MGKIIINVDYTDNFAAAPANDNIACISTGRTLEELKRNMEEALRWHIESMREDGEPVPEEFDGEWQLEWNLSVRALLHYTEKLVPKAAIAKVTGINQQQLTHYASGYREPRPAMRARIIEGIHQIARQLSAIS
jgi:predicted RNase H-like HicB family nuclease